MRVVLTSGDLVFCAHHAKAYEATLRNTAVEWLDESALVQP